MRPAICATCKAIPEVWAPMTPPVAARPEGVLLTRRFARVWEVLRCLSAVVHPVIPNCPQAAVPQPFDAGKLVGYPMRCVFVRLPTGQQQHLPRVVDALEHVVLDEAGRFRIQAQVCWQQV